MLMKKYVFDYSSKSVIWHGHDPKRAVKRASTVPFKITITIQNIYKNV